MKQMKKALALLLAMALLLTFTACGKDEDKTDSSTNTTTATDATTTAPNATTTTTTQPSDELLPDDERDGSKDLPFEIGGVLEFDAAVKAGGTTYYDVFRVDGTILTLKSANATIEYEGKTYTPDKGVISFPVSSDDVLNPVKLAITNTGSADATFKVTFAYPQGTLLNPYELAIGEVVTVIQEGNESGVVYLYTATEDGTFSVQDKSVTKGDGYDIEVYNLNSGANRTLNEDAVDNVVSVTASKGDQIRITYLVLPDDKNAYPAITLKSTIGFKTGTVNDKPVEKKVDYTVIIKDQLGNPIPGVKISISSEMIAATVTTDSKGVAKANLPEGVPTGTLEVPNGYIAASKRFSFKAGETTVTIVMEKEQIAPPTTPTKPTNPTDPNHPTQPTVPEVTTLDYTVTLLDGKGAPVGGLTVVFFSGDTQVAKQVGNDKGVSTVKLERGTYTVKVEGTELKYDEKAAVVAASAPDLTLVLATALNTIKGSMITDPLTDKRIKANYVAEGATYMSLKAGERNYFLFEPKRGGTYRFDASNNYARVGYFGTDMFVFPENNATINANAFTMSVQNDEVGNVFVIGIDAATNCSAAVLRITRVGDPAWSIENEPTVEFKGSGAPADITAPGTLVDVDIKSATEHHLVYNSKDGYYHLDSANGPVVYVRMNNKYASIVGLLSEFGNMTAYIYNADGTFKAKEQYAVLMQKYVDKMDPDQSAYPLTKDLEYMIRNYGNSQNWWNEGKPGYLFEEVEGVNPANASLFLYCYKK